MNDHVRVAQNGTRAPEPVRIKLTKPSDGAAQVIPVASGVVLDLSDFARQDVVMVHAGDRLIILFADHATIVLAGFYGRDGLPLAGLDVDLGRGATVPATQAVSLLPISEDQSVLPAAGPASPAGAPLSSAFAPSSVMPDALGDNKRPLDLLLANDFGSGAPAASEPKQTHVNSIPTFDGVTSGNVTEDVATVAAGVLTISEVDTGENSVVVQDHTAGTYGAFSVDASGHWSYQLDNGNAAVQALGAKQTLTETFAVVSFDGTATETITVTIQGTNDIPVLGGGVHGAVIEDGILATAGVLTIADVDTGESNFAAQSATAGHYGTFSVDASGHWTYTLDDTNGAVQALGAGKILTETFAVLSSDGSASESVIVTITGTNDVPVLGGLVASSVTEDGILTASGTLTIADVDAGESNFAAQSATAGHYGTFAVDASGHWTYALDNANGTVQALGAGKTLTETFAVRSSDGSASEIVTVTIDGTNDVPVLGGDVARTVTEDISLTAIGTLTIADVDNAESSFVAQSHVAGLYGAFSVDSVGNWIYQLDNNDAAVQALGAGKSLTEQFTVRSFDGSATETVTVTIDGTNDLPVIGGQTSGTVAEDVTLSITGALTISDVDTGEAHFIAQSNTVGTYGAFSVGTNGQWSYALANSSGAVQSLGAGSHPTETFTVISADGTTQDVTITVNGRNDAPTLYGVTNGYVTEDSVYSVGNNIYITDRDTGEAFYTPQTNTSGLYGTFSIDAAGHWSYALDNTSSAVQSLGAGVNPTETFKAWSADLSASLTITVTVKGANDVPIIGGNATGSVTEDFAPSVNGLLTISDPDTNQSTFTAQSATVGTYGTFTVTAAGAWTYTLANSTAVQNLGSNSHPTETFTVWSSDHTASQTVTVTVNGTNDAPSGTSKTVTTLEDTAYTFSTSDFGFSSSEGDALAGVKITQLPVAGSLTLNGFAISANQTVTASDIASGLLKFAPAANANGSGYATFQFAVQDNGGTAHGGVDLDQSPNTITLNVTAVNDAPSGADKTIAALEDVAYVFTAADFGFTDAADGNTLSGVKFTQLPGAGSLTLSGATVSANQIVSISSINSGLLKFTAAANANGSSYASLQFAVQDNGGTLNGGVDLDQSPNTITLNITAVNDAPSGAGKSIITLEDTAYTFSTPDFGFTDPDGNALLAVKIAALPTTGNLTLNGVAVALSQTVSASDIALGLLKYTPAANSTSGTSFRFQVQDDGGTANGGVDLDPSQRTITVNVTAVNDAPILDASKNVAFTTVEDAATPVNGTAGILVSTIADRVIDGNGFDNVTDVDSFIAGIAIVGTNTSQGTWYYSVTNGATWSIVGAVSDTSALLLRPEYLLYFKPSANYSGTIADAITFRAWDISGGTPGQYLNVSSNGGSTPYSAATDTISVTVTAVNDAPTTSGLANASVAENQSGALIRTFSVSDVDTASGLTFRVLDAANAVDSRFTIVAASGTAPGQPGTYELRLAAGQSLDFEAENADGSPTIALKVEVNDQGSANNLTTTPITVTVTNVNEAPTAVALNNAVTSIAENTSTAGAIKVADIAVTDDALGTNALSLSGADAASFQIIGSALYLKAGVVLDFETKTAYNVTINVDDTTVGATPDLTKTFTLNVTDVNEAPTAMALNNAVTSIAENTSTAGAIKVADIAVTDDALGTNVLSLSGAEAASFQIVGNALYLKAGVALDYEAKTTYHVSVNVDDTAVGASPDLTQTFTLTVTDVNEAPTAVAFNNAITSIAENTSTASAIKVADIAIADDALGTNVLSLSGAEAASFQIVGNALYLKAGVVLDYETKTAYNVAVNVDDTTVGPTPDLIRSFTLNVTDVAENHAPVASSPTIAAGSGSEDMVLTFGSGPLTANFTDPDNDALTVMSVSATSANGATVTLNTATGQVTYDPTHAATLQALNVGGNATDSFTYTVSDGHGGTATATATITVTGVNDAAVITGATTATINEIGTSGGTASITRNLDATDVDNPNDAWQAVTTQTASSGHYGTYVIDAAGAWTYTLDNANATVNALKVGASLTDTFTVYTVDGTSQVVMMTINGADDAPVARSDFGTMTEDTGTAVFDVLANDTLDPDTGAPNTVSVGSIFVTGGSSYGIDASDLLVTVIAGNQIQVQLLGTDWNNMWTGAQFNVSINYALNGDQGMSSVNVLSLTMTGLNDAPVLVTSASPSITTLEDAPSPVHGTVGTAVSTLIDSVNGSGLDNWIDPDSFIAGIAIVGQNAGQGTWFYSLDGGNSWSVMAAVSASSALVLRPEYLLYFKPNADYSGTVADALTFRAWDGSGGTSGTYNTIVTTGGTSPYSTATDTISLTVTAVNDAAVVTGTTTGAVTEAGGIANGTPGTPTAAGDLNSTDVDNPADAWQAVTTATASTGGYGTYTIDATGHWSYTVDNANATVNSLAAGAPLSDTFTVKTIDGTAQVVTITITGANDAPALDLDANNDSAKTGVDYQTNYTGGSAAKAIADTDSHLTDADNSTMASATITLTNAQTGDALNINTSTLSSLGIAGTVDTSVSGKVTVSLTGPASLANYESAIESVTFSSTSSNAADRAVTVTVNDGAASSGVATTMIHVTPAATVTAVAHDDTISPLPAGWSWLAANGHIYEYFAVGTSWSNAVSLAAGQISGASYLATITSAAEDSLIDSFLGGGYRTYLGASDATTEGTWTWMTGPEAGTVFWVGGTAGTGGAAVNGAFIDWSSTNPSGVSGIGEDEDYLATDLSHNWNDVSASGSGLVIGYTAEAGGNGSTYSTINEDSPFSFSQSWLLSNDANAPAAIPSVAATSGKGAAVSFDSSTGMITYDASGSATLQALAAGQSTTDTFTYQISDGHGGSSTATVTVTVAGVNDVASINGAAAALVTEDVTLSPGQSGLTLTGTPGVDTLTGDGGNDILLGGLGADVLTGGLGSDTFCYTATAQGGDTIKDFTHGEDLISILNSILGTSEIGLLDHDGTTAAGSTVLFEAVAGATTGAQHDSAKLIFDTAGHDLYYDGDGGASASGRILLAHLENGSILDASDIKLVAA